MKTVVIDTSALLAFVQEKIDFIEKANELLEEPLRFVVLKPCLAELGAVAKPSAFDAIMRYLKQRGASVDWDCGPTHFNRTIGSAFDPAGSGAPGSLVSGALLVTCRFDTWPPPAPGSVSIGGADCGPMASG